MKTLKPLHLRSDVRAALLCLCLAPALLAGGLPIAAPAQPAEADTPAPAATTTNVVAAGGTNAPVLILAGAGTNRVVRPPRTTAALAGDTNALTLSPDLAKAGDTNSDEILLSFQGADINMVVQWLMQTTGKTVLKSQQVQGQVNVSNAKKLPKRQAIDLVYRALSMDGFSVTETANFIAITREGQEPKVGAELLSSTATNVPEGRQRMIKMFPLSHAQAGDLRDRIRIVLSEKATVDVDDRGNQLIVTDYNDNLRVLTELMKELDVTTTSDFTLQIYPLKYAEAEEIGNLISMILNAQAPPPPSAPGRPPSGGGSSRPPGGNPSMAMVLGGPSMDSGPSSSSSSPGGGGASAAPAQQVRIWSDKNANRLIVSAPRSKLPEVERLVGILDTNKPEDVAVRVLPLKRVAAVDVVKEIGDLYKTLSGRSLKEVIQITADDQSNSLIILSSEANFHNIEKLMAAMDTEDAQEKIMKTFILKNADATDVAKQLQDLNTEQTGNSRYNIIVYNPYGSSSGGGKSKKMTVVADRRRNAVIVQSPPAQMDAIETMISELDQTVDDASLAPKVYQLKYVSASDIEDVLNELFLKKTQQRSYWDYNNDTYSSERTDQDAGRLYGKVRITSEPYSNTLIVTSNSRENLDVVENVLKQLDQPAEGGESTLRIGLRFAKSEVLARNLNILFARNGSPGFGQQRGQGGGGVQQPQQPQTQQTSANAYQGNFDLGVETIEEGYYSWLGGGGDNASRTADGRSSSIRPVSDLVGRVRVVPDRRGNGLLISANAHLFPQILKLVNDLDAPADQVLIEARLLEVSTDFLDKLGVRWSPDGSKVFTAEDFDNSIIAHVTADYTHGFGPNTLVNTPSAATVAQSLVALRSGVLSSTINMDFLVQFLKKTTDATILAEPQINVRDNETGRLFVGQQVPVPDNNTAYQGNQTTTLRYKNVGIVLEVTPHINNAGDVELRVHAEASTTVPGVTVLGGAVFDTRAFLTDLRAKDGETLILGGIIQKQVSDTLRKTPFFGDIPGLGWAFKKKDKTTHTVELMVFLRPRVVRNSEEARELMREMDQKAPLIKKWDDDSAQQSKDQQEKEKKK